MAALLASVGAKAGNKAIDIAEGIAAHEADAIKERGLLYYLGSRFILIGAMMLIAGLAMAFGAYMLQGAGQRAKADAGQKMAAMWSIFGNITNPAGGESWGGWNIGQDFSYIGSAIYGTASDAINALGDIPKGIVGAFSLALPAGLEELAGAIVYGVGWVGEQVFPWLMTLGLICLLIGIVLRVVHWYITNIHDYLQPRLVIRDKATKRRWLQKPFDKILLPRSVTTRAAEYNEQETLVNNLAFNEGADLPAAQRLQAAIEERAATAAEVGEARATVITAEEAASAKDALEEGKRQGKEGWEKAIRSGIVTVVSVVPSEQTPETVGDEGMRLRQEAMMLHAAGSRARAVVPVVGSDGELGLAIIGFTALQATNLGKAYGQRYVIHGYDRLLATVQDVTKEKKGDLLHRYRAVKFFEGEEPDAEDYTVLPEQGLAFELVDDIGDKPKTPEVKVEAPKPAPPPEKPAPPIVPEEKPTKSSKPFTMEEWQELTKDEKEEVARDSPMLVPDEGWKELGREETL